MNENPAALELANLLNRALARELQVSIQYMLQHSVGAALGHSNSGAHPSTRQDQFVASHVLYFLPGSRLKTIAITEMRHAEAIAERVVLLGGQPTTEPHSIILGANTREMLENDRRTEQEAIDLYGEIVAKAEAVGDSITARLFTRILSDERKHHQAFSRLLQEMPQTVNARG